MFQITMESLISFTLNGVRVSYLPSCNLSSDRESRTFHIKITGWIRPVGHLAQSLSKTSHKYFERDIKNRATVIFPKIH